MVSRRYKNPLPRPTRLVRQGEEIAPSCSLSTFAATKKRQVAVSEKRKRDAEEGGDALKSLENTTLGSKTERDEMKSMELRKMLDLLVHTAQCVSAKCQYTNCSKVKGLFNHGIHCKISYTGHCVLCKKMWYLLQLHARGCKESECHVPRCRDLKEHIRKLKQESDSRQKSCHDGDDETESCRGCQNC